MRSVWISILLAWLVVVPAVAVVETLIAFEIDDQFKVAHTDLEYRQGILVVVGCDRKGSAFSREWTEAVRESLASIPDAPEARVVGLAHLKGAPRLLRGVIRRSFPTQPEAWVLLDWQGLFEDAYGFEKDSATLLVFLDGELVHTTSGQEVEAAKVEEIRVALERALAAPTSVGGIGSSPPAVAPSRPWCNGFRRGVGRGGGCDCRDARSDAESAAGPSGSGEGVEAARASVAGGPKRPPGGPGGPAACRHRAPGASPDSG